MAAGESEEGERCSGEGAGEWEAVGTCKEEDEAEGLVTGGVVVIVRVAGAVEAAEALGDGAADAAEAEAEDGWGEGRGDFFPPDRSGDGGTGTPSFKFSNASCSAT